MRLEIDMLKNSMWYDVIISKSGSSKLTNEQRRAFIIEINEHNVLLAARCRSNIFKIDEILDETIIKKATRIAKFSKKPHNASLALSALAEIGQFSLISDLLKEIRIEKKIGFLKNIVDNLIRNANEQQIVEFLTILISLNIVLFHRAIDLLFKEQREFSSSSRLKISRLLKESKISKLIVIKIVIALKLPEIKGLDPFNVMNLLFINKSFDFGIWYFENYLNCVNLDFKTILSNSFTDISTKELSNVLEFITRNKIEVDERFLIENLCRNSNVIIKEVGNQRLEQLKDTELKRTILNSIIQENLQLNVVSSIDFSFNLVQRYDLFDSFSPESFVQSYINTGKSTALYKAYKLITDYNLQFRFNIEELETQIFDTNDPRTIIDSIELLKINNADFNQILLSLAIRYHKGSRENEHYKSIWKHIILHELSPCYSLNELQINKEYFAIVLGYFKGELTHGYYIQIGELKPIFYPADKLKRRFSAGYLIKVKILSINPKDEKVWIEITDTNVYRTKLKKRKCKTKKIKKPKSKDNLSDFGM